MKSKCTVARSTPLEWRLYFDWYNESFIRYKTWLIELPDAVRELVDAEVETRREMAAKGQVTEELKKFLIPVRTQPGLFEIKWNTRAAGKNIHIRQYHGEPETIPQLLVASHIHLKDVSGHRDEITKKQNEEMNFAQERFAEGLSTGWN